MDAIREEAERYYSETKDHYGDALRVESEAREKCTADIKAAYKQLPEFKGTIPDPEQFLRSLGPLQGEAREASVNPNVQLPGSGSKVDSIPTVRSDVVVSEALMRIATRVDGLPEAQGNNYWLWSNSDDGRREYISANKELIRAAAGDSGLPPEMVAGIAWQEVEGDPGWRDEAAYEGRKVHPGSEDPDQTSMGPMAIQVRRAAEVLGYDPHNLTDMQRDQVVSAIKDPAKNIFIASEYLAQFKAESGFADVPPEQMTRAQMQELAARYSGGPYYESEAAREASRLTALDRWDPLFLARMWHGLPSALTGRVTDPAPDNSFTRMAQRDVPPIWVKIKLVSAPTEAICERRTKCAFDESSPQSSPRQPSPDSASQAPPPRPPPPAASPRPASSRPASPRVSARTAAERSIGRRPRSRPAEAVCTTGRRSTKPH